MDPFSLLQGCGHDASIWLLIRTMGMLKIVWISYNFDMYQEVYVCGRTVELICRIRGGYIVKGCCRVSTMDYKIAVKVLVSDALSGMLAIT
jgi:hypothetical protein